MFIQLNGVQDEITEFIGKKDSRRKKKRLEKKKYYIVKHDNNTSMDESSKSKSFDKKLKMSSDIKKLSGIILFYITMSIFCIHIYFSLCNLYYRK